MTVKLFEIFISLPDKFTYSAKELCALKLAPNFIKKMASCYNLTYVENTIAEGNVCFAESKEVRLEYRTTFSKLDVLENVFSQLSGEAINMEQDEVVFSENFFSSQ